MYFARWTPIGPVQPRTPIATVRIGSVMVWTNPHPLTPDGQTTSLQLLFFRTYHGPLGRFMREWGWEDEETFRLSKDLESLVLAPDRDSGSRSPSSARRLRAFWQEVERIRIRGRIEGFGLADLAHRLGSEGGLTEATKLLAPGVSPLMALPSGEVDYVENLTYALAYGDNVRDKLRGLRSLLPWAPSEATRRITRFWIGQLGTENRP